MTFQDLGLIRPILRALADMGYQRPSPIQEKAISPALAGRDVLGCAQTGTGKTCAFAAPILQRLNARAVQGRPIRSLILTPTRELAIQIQESFASYGKYLPLKSAVIFGGVGQQPQVDALRAGVDILVATPGRLLDLQGQGHIDLSHLEIFVLDEADRMLDMGFIHDVRKVLKLLPAKKQTLFFSATMPPEVMELVNGLLHDPVKVAVDPISSPVEVIRQSVYLVDKGNKTKLLALLIDRLNAKNALVFTRTKHGANKVASDLVKAGVGAAAIHGNKSQTARVQALSDFKAGRIRCLVATDIAARGLDIEELSHVFNYNLPEVPETYVHRIGRTGRAGRGGVAVSFCDFAEQEYLKGIEKLIGKKVPQVDDHPWPMQVLEAPKDAKGRPVNADDQEARQAAREKKKEKNAQKAAENLPPKGQAAAPKGPAAEKPDKPKPEKKRPLTGQPKPRQEQPKPKQEPKTQAPPQAKTERELAFERWMAEERAIQAGLAKQRSRSSGDDVIMDATARLLAPRQPDKTAVTAPPPPQPQPPTQESSGKRKRKKKKKGSQAPAPQEQKKPEEAPRQKTPAKPHRDHERSHDRRSGPPEVTLRASGQKDSTEQPSLMKPYYLTPDD